MSERVERFLNTLDSMFPDAKCELNYSNMLELLIAVMLSAQTTDASVNKLTITLFKKYPTVEDYANADINELMNDIRTIGLYKNKANNIKKMTQTLLSQYNGEVPSDRASLEALPGVGRKTTNVVLAEGFHIPALAVDTHVERVSKRLKLAYQNDSVLKVEEKLKKKIPKQRWIKTHHQMIFFGRYHCKAINPDCGHCPLIDLCREEKRKKYL